MQYLAQAQGPGRAEDGSGRLFGGAEGPFWPYKGLTRSGERVPDLSGFGPRKRGSSEESRQENPGKCPKDGSRPQDMLLWQATANHHPARRLVNGETKGRDDEPHGDRGGDAS